MCNMLTEERRNSSICANNVQRRTLRKGKGARKNARNNNGAWRHSFDQKWCQKALNVDFDTKNYSMTLRTFSPFCIKNNRSCSVVFYFDFPNFERNQFKKDEFSSRFFITTESCRWQSISRSSQRTLPRTIQTKPAAAELFSTCRFLSEHQSHSCARSGNIEPSFRAKHTRFLRIKTHASFLRFDCVQP